MSAKAPRLIGERIAFRSLCQRDRDGLPAERLSVVFHAAGSDVPAGKGPRSFFSVDAAKPD